jgi:phage baseplate assembly protein V
VIAEIINKIKAGIGKALIESVVDTGAIQLVKIQLMENEIQDGVERIQNYGLTSNPPKGSECVPVFVGGSRDHGVAVAVDCGAFRVTGLASGEVCVYSKFGQKILLKANGETVFNDGTDYAVAFNDLKTAFDTLVSNFNSHIHAITVAGAVPAAPPTPVTGTSAVPTASTASIDGAKVAKVRLP